MILSAKTCTKRKCVQIHQSKRNKKSKFNVHRSPSPQKLLRIRKDNKSSISSIANDNKASSSIKTKSCIPTGFNDYYPNETRPRTSKIRREINSTLNIQTNAVIKSKVKIALKEPRSSSVAGSTKLSDTPKCSTIGDRRKWVKHFLQEKLKNRNRLKSIGIIKSLSMEDQIKKMLKRSRKINLKSINQVYS